MWIYLLLGYEVTQCIVSICGSSPLRNVLYFQLRENPSFKLYLVDHLIYFRDHLIFRI